MSVPTSVKVGAVAILAFLGVFAATAFAATAVVPAGDTSWVDMLRPVYDAFAHGQKLYAGMLALVLAVSLAKKYAPDKWGLHSDIGGALVTLAGSFGTAMVTSLAGGVTFHWVMVKTASMIAVGAAGGYSLIKKLIVEPFLRPYAAKAPAWLKAPLAMILWIFDKPSPVAVAEAAGDKAVEAHPAGGIADVVGATKDVE